MQLIRHMSVSCGIAESKKGNLLTVQDVLKALDWIEENDAPENMLYRIDYIRRKLQE